MAVRIVTDDDHGLRDEANEALRKLQAAGVAVVDDERSGLMHNKFMIMDANGLDRLLELHRQRHLSQQ